MRYGYWAAQTYYQQRDTKIHAFKENYSGQRRPICGAYFSVYGNRGFITIERRDFESYSGGNFCQNCRRVLGK